MSTPGSPPGLERWERRYGAEGYVFGTAPSGFLARQAHLLHPGMTALAVADGEGRNGVWLAERGLDVLAVDFSPTGQAKAVALAAERGVALRTECADLAQWAFPTAAFDVVVAIFFQFAGPAVRTRIFDGIRRSLKPDGLLLLQGYRPEQLAYGTGGPSEVENLYTHELLESAFAGFSELSIHAYDAPLSEGGGHAGMSALIELVGRL
jgi:cyclopropane fatty-acyl-phospholipid synthase-like methyltransferase